MSAVEALKRHLREADVEVDEDMIEYCGTIVESWVDGKEFTLNEWVEGLTPILGEYLEQEEQLRSFCQSLIEQLNPQAGKDKARGKQQTQQQQQPAAHAKAATNGTSHETASDMAGAIGQVLLENKNITLGFLTGRMLLQKAQVTLIRGRIYGVVGKNGAGKTTFIRRIANRELPGFPVGVRTAYVAHEVSEDDESISVDAFMEKAAALPGARDKAEIPKVMAELGFTQEMQAKPIKELSGGWKMRLALARAMYLTADLLCLDEPTNHLDVETVHWLQGYLLELAARGVTVLTISHDPAFLDAVASDVLLLQDSKITHHVGNFTSFSAANLGFGTKDLLECASVQQQGVKFEFPDPGDLPGIPTRSRIICKVKDVSFRYSKRTPLVLDGVSAKLCLASRVACVGPNGSGKSTLVKLMVGEMVPSKGLAWRHHNLRVAYVAQHSFFHLQEHMRTPCWKYIQDRFRGGVDNEHPSLKPVDIDVENATEETESQEFKRDSKAPSFEGKTVQAILGRRKYKKTQAYEVQWEGYSEYDNTWESMKDLEKLGANVVRMMQACDARLKAKRAGVDRKSRLKKDILPHLAAYDLDRKTATGAIVRLSGGQRSRLVLAAAMWNKPHLLVLDEPTNYLDQDSLVGLEKAINKFKGAVIVVSHNHTFLSAICNEVWRVADGKVECEKLQETYQYQPSLCSSSLKSSYQEDENSEEFVLAVCWGLAVAGKKERADR
eukprot:g80804.t1